MINILYLHETSLISGAEQSLLNLVRNLDRRKFDPSFVLPQEGALADELKSEGVRVFLMPFPKIRRFLGVASALRSLGAIIRDNNISIVHSNSIRTHVYGAWAAKRNNVPVVWHQRNMLRGEIADPDRLLMSLPDRIICNSQAIAQRFASGGRIPEKVRVVFNGVDIARFNPFVDGAAVRNEFGILPGETVVGITSRFNVQKGHETLFNAAAAIRSDDPALWKRLKLLVVGGAVFESDRPREKYLKDMTRALGINDRVIFTGYRNDMPRMYASMDIFVLTSDAEACGRVILEAMAAGKPVVATNSGGTPEVIKDGVSGALFSFGDSLGLAGKITGIMAEPGAAGTLGAAARAVIEKGFTIQSHARKIELIYEGLIRARA
ncbi:MAG: glycosyltransferase [Candidatus Omnitrophota bacterium]